MSTLYTFVPSVKTGVKPSSSVGLDSFVSASSEIYTTASWTMPQDKKDSLFSASPYPFDFHKAQEFSEETKLKLQKSREDFSRSIAAREDFEKNLKELSAPDSHSELAETPAVANTESDLIPKSYEEIFSISVKNRMKNKEKKRLRDDETNGPDDSDATTGAPGDSTPHDFSSLKGQEYFTSSAVPVETDVNSTLEFGSQLGWVKNAEHRNSLKESYLKEASELQPGENSESASGSGSARVSSSSKTSSSMEKKSGGNQGSKSYEYSKSNNAMSIGAMLPKGENSGAQGGHNNKKPANKSHQSQQPFRVKAEVHNPYFSARDQFEK